MRKIIRIANEFWIEGDWTASVTVYADNNLDNMKAPVKLFHVNWRAVGMATPEEAREFLGAIEAATNYAQKMTDTNELTYLELKDLWNSEFSQNLDLIQGWHDANKAVRAARKKARG